MKLPPQEVEVLLASKNAVTGDNIETVRVRYWRAIHAELMTHRAFSRNAGSSRAIPVKKMLAQVWGDPAGPQYWGANQSGMQAARELKGWRLWAAKKVWTMCARFAAFGSWLEMKIGLHKQVANRITEPYQYINVIVTATDWDNFWHLRCHKDAQPEFRLLAEEMRTKVLAARIRPQMLKPGEWHMPYVMDSEKNIFSLSTRLKIATARIARISYEAFDGDASLPKEIERHDKLVGGDPIHASPTEHSAVAAHGRGHIRNFQGFMQYRVFVEEKRPVEDPFQMDLTNTPVPTLPVVRSAA